MTAVRKPSQRQEPAPTTLTAQSIRDQIPAHFFKQNTAKSVGYLCRDLVQSVVTAAVMWYAVLPAAAAVSAATGSSIVTAAAYFVAWNLYAFIQGLNWTGIWVLAHECGHRAFSPSTAINDAFGIVLHSALLVPYHSWRISHGNHHKHTNHLELDTVFVPEKIEKKELAAREAVKDAPVVSLIKIVVMLTLGWPGYLFANLSGQTYAKRANHFEPTSPLFRVAERPDIVKSDLGLITFLAFLGMCAYEFGATNVLLWYAMPYLWVNFWLVFITYLQHSDERIPHYTPDKWNFVRGALSTVDRDFGPALNWWLHHINDSHVVHHLFSTMPFYNAIQVTRKHIKPILGDQYVSDNGALLPTLWTTWRACAFLVRDDGVAYYRS